ncbi:hypothetical protein L0F63_000118, partial [Massospora cicadina]
SDQRDDPIKSIPLSRERVSLVQIVVFTSCEHSVHSLYAGFDKAGTSISVVYE